MFARSFLALLLSLLGSTLAGAQNLTVVAAASVRHAMQDIVASYQQQFPDDAIRIIFGASGGLTTQIINGAPFDLFFSADTALPQRLYDEGLTTGKPVVYAEGRLVLWSADLDASTLTLHDLTSPNIRRIAMAQPRTAPYGQRAQEALTNLGLWDVVEEKIVFGENISQAARMAEAGAAEIGLIALSLAVVPPLNDQPFQLIDRDLHAPLTQAFVITRRAASNPIAHRFADFIGTPEVTAILRQHGLHS
ncbi:molybdate ABC transporter substrate-binding protein [Salinispirillum marinum]|uniref:Molybdate ABC transporter substrate-binding protein n=2 Tax=Saccharospirillaceae TaxID=255527 RepID=A0ABV8BKJ8_9GAMM